MKIYDKLHTLPTGTASGGITPGCLVLEGGGWKGLYTLGVLDCLMERGINFSSVVGVSAGALSALGYVARQIGWGARIDLTYRHDSNYCGLGALRRDHGVTGFSYLFQDLCRDRPIADQLDQEPSRRLAVSATNLLTGQVEYFEKGHCDLFKAVQASATVPYVSRPVLLNGVPYLDGGCAEKIPLPWALASGEKKLLVVRTRELSYRRKPGVSKLASVLYRKYPRFVQAMASANQQFNETVERWSSRQPPGSCFSWRPPSR